MVRVRNACIERQENLFHSDFVYNLEDRVLKGYSRIWNPFLVSPVLLANLMDLPTIVIIALPKRSSRSSSESMVIGGSIIERNFYD